MKGKGTSKFLSDTTVKIFLIGLEKRVNRIFAALGSFAKKEDLEECCDGVKDTIAALEKRVSALESGSAQRTEESIELDPTSLDFEAEGGEQTLGVKSDAAWTLETE